MYAYDCTHRVSVSRYVNKWMGRKFLWLNARFDISTQLDSVGLQTTEHVNNLGVVLDSDLKCNSQLLNQLTQLPGPEQSRLGRILFLCS